MTPSRFLLSASAALFTLSLAACGGGGSSADAGGGGGGGGGSSATIASASKFSFPGGTPDLGSLGATNDGVYVRLYDNAVATDVIAKRTLGRGTPAGWLQTTLPVTAGKFAPIVTDNEGVDEFAIHWNGIAPGTGTNRYGTSYMNNGGASTSYLDDFSVDRIVPDGDATSTGREWGIRAGRIYRKSASGSVSTSFSARFPLVIDLNDAGVDGTPSAADGTGNLYVASSTVLYQVGTTGTRKAWDLSSLGFGAIHTLVYRHSRLWVGYSDRVLYLPAGGDTVYSFTTLDNGFAQVATRPQFCIVGTTLYGSDGMSYEGIDLPASASARPWLQGPGTLSADQSMAVTEMSAAVRSGIVCAGPGSSAWGPTVYATGPDLASGSGTFKLFAIQPR